MAGVVTLFPERSPDAVPILIKPDRPTFLTSVSNSLFALETGINLGYGSPGTIARTIQDILSYHIHFGICRLNKDTSSPSGNKAVFSIDQINTREDIVAYYSDQDFSTNKLKYMSVSIKALIPFLAECYGMIISRERTKDPPPLSPQEKQINLAFEKLKEYKSSIIEKWPVSTNTIIENIKTISGYNVCLLISREREECQSSFRDMMSEPQERGRLGSYDSVGYEEMDTENLLDEFPQPNDTPLETDNDDLDTMIPHSAKLSKKSSGSKNELFHCDAIGILKLDHIYLPVIGLHCGQFLERPHFSTALDNAIRHTVNRMERNNKHISVKKVWFIIQMTFPQVSRDIFDIQWAIYQSNTDEETRKKHEVKNKGGAAEPEENKATVIKQTHTLPRTYMRGTTLSWDRKSGDQRRWFAIVLPVNDNFTTSTPHLNWIYVVTQSYSIHHFNSKPDDVYLRVGDEWVAQTKFTIPTEDSPKRSNLQIPVQWTSLTQDKKKSICNGHYGDSKGKIYPYIALRLTPYHLILIALLCGSPFSGTDGTNLKECIYNIIKYSKARTPTIYPRSERSLSIESANKIGNASYKNTTPTAPNPETESSLEEDSVMMFNTHDWCGDMKKTIVDFTDILDKWDLRKVRNSKWIAVDTTAEHQTIGDLTTAVIESQLVNRDKQVKASESMYTGKVNRMRGRELSPPSLNLLIQPIYFTALIQYGHKDLVQRLKKITKSSTNKTLKRWIELCTEQD